MAQAVSRYPFTVESRVQSKVSQCGIFGGKSDTGTGGFFSPSTWILIDQYHSNNPLFAFTDLPPALYLGTSVIDRYVT